MESHGNTMFYELCRLCLKKPGEKLIFEDEWLAGDISLFIGVIVTSTDNLPPKVCSTCLDVLTKVKELRALATANDTHLRFLFDDGQTPNENTEYTTYLIVQPTPKAKNLQDTQNELPSSTTSTVKSPSALKMKIAVRKDLFVESFVEKDKEPKKKKKKVPIKLLHTVKKHKERRKEREVEASKSTSESKHKVLKASTSSNSKEKILKVVVTRMKESAPKSEPADASTDESKKKGETDVFTCSICSKVVRTWRRYYNHQRLHNKKNICPFDACLKKFSTKGDLAKHVRTHTGEKPYRCSLCDKTFAQNVTLKGHMKAVHSGFVES